MINISRIHIRNHLTLFFLLLVNVYSSLFIIDEKGVPIRVEVGPRDFANKQARLVRRDTGERA